MLGEIVFKMNSFASVACNLMPHLVVSPNPIPEILNITPNQKVRVRTVLYSRGETSAVTLEGGRSVSPSRTKVG